MEQRGPQPRGLEDHGGLGCRERIREDVLDIYSYVCALFSRTTVLTPEEDAGGYKNEKSIFSLGMPSRRLPSELANK